MKCCALVVALSAMCLAHAPIATSAQESSGPTQPAPAAFQVVPLGQNSAVMVDLRTGQSWKLERDPENQPGFVWAPVRKLSTNMEIDQWREKMKAFRAEQRKRRMAEFGPVEPFEGALPLIPQFRIDPDAFAPDPTDNRDPFDNRP